MPSVQLQRLQAAAVVPRRMTEAAAGYDLSACLPQPIVLLPGARVRVPTGWAIAIPNGFEGQVRPRSGLAFEHGVTVINAPGTIDADYRGELAVLLVNLGAEPFTIEHGQRVAQLVVAPVAPASFVEVATLPKSARGEGGFGSTG
jgi:dUTP pyrophosphatase